MLLFQPQLLSCESLHLFFGTKVTMNHFRFYQNQNLFTIVKDGFPIHVTTAEFSLVPIYPTRNRLKTRYCSVFSCIIRHRNSQMDLRILDRTFRDCVKSVLKSGDIQEVNDCGNGESCKQDLIDFTVVPTDRLRKQNFSGLW